MRVNEAIKIGGSGLNYNRGYKQLPPGHIKIKKAIELVHKIYRKSDKIEEFFYKRTKNKPDTPRQCLKLCDKICDKIGDPRLKCIHINSPKARGYGGVYCDGIIYFPYRQIHYDTLIHELAHHVSAEEGHGEEFCSNLVLLFLVSYEILTGKAPKPDWEHKIIFTVR